MPTTKPTEEGTKQVIADLAERIEARYKEVSAGWPAEMAGAGDKIMGLIQEEVTTLLSGDFTAVRDALVADIAASFRKGSGPVGKNLSAIA